MGSIEVGASRKSCFQCEFLRFRVVSNSTTWQDGKSDFIPYCSLGGFGLAPGPVCYRMALWLAQNSRPQCTVRRAGDGADGVSGRWFERVIAGVAKVVGKVKVVRVARVAKGR